MPLFQFDARGFDGRRVRGALSAADVGALDRALEEQQLVLVRARTAAARTSARGGRALIDMCHHLATALEAGVPLVTTLRDLQEGGTSPLAGMLEDVAGKVESGATLAQALEDHPALFTPLARSLVAAGEQTGELPRILRELVAYLQWSEDLRRKLSSALLYPCIVGAGTIGLVALLTTVVLPTFLALFVELRVELPLATRAMIAAQHFFAGYWPWLAALAAACVVAFLLTLRSASGRYQLHRTLLATPLLGRVVTMIEMSRFAHNFGLLYGAGVPILRALEMVAGIAQNLVVREALTRSGEAVRGGAGLSAALAETGALPPLVLRMLGLGERTGALDRSLAHAASYYDRELPVLIDRSLALFNTALIASLGALLATIALGIFVPLYQMMGQLNETP